MDVMKGGSVDHEMRRCHVKYVFNNSVLLFEFSLLTSYLCNSNDI